MRQINLFLFFLFFSLGSVYTQQKFDCDGAAFISVVDENEITTFYELSVGDQSIVQSPVSDGFDNNINAIGFNRKDSLIYGIDPEQHQLFRIGSDGVVEGLQYLPLQGKFYAGDVTPDGSQLVLFNRDSIALIDLGASEMPVSYLSVSTTDSLGVFATDIAYHPVTNVLYGYDAVQGKLIIINDSTGLVDNSTFDPINYNSGLPAMFFDARGELYGIGTDNAAQNSILFQFDLQDGTVSRSSFEGNFGDRDGCSCPYTVKLFQKQSNDYLVPCSTLELVLTVANLAGQELSGFSLVQDFPEGYLIESISYNPFVSDIVSGAGTNQLLLTNMEIPYGIDSIKFLVNIPSTASGELHGIQAVLEGNDALTLETKRLVSDDLNTGEKDDPTILEIRSVSELYKDIVPQWVELCEGDSFYLSLPIDPEIQYVWSDSVDASSRVFTASNDLRLDVITACKKETFDFSILETDFQVDLGEDIVAVYGDFVTLDPEVNSISAVTDYKWLAARGDIPCDNCPAIQVRPLSDETYVVIAENETGCTTKDEITIYVDRGVYTPNIFSPNQDGINDFFYLLSGNPVIEIKELHIYDRWGGQVFEAKDIFSNSETSGWNGTRNGEACPVGSYFWTAILKYNDARSTPIQGQLILNR